MLLADDLAQKTLGGEWQPENCRGVAHAAVAKALIRWVKGAVQVQLWQAVYRQRGYMARRRYWIYKHKKTDAAYGFPFRVAANSPPSFFHIAIMHLRITSIVYSLAQAIYRMERCIKFSLVISFFTCATRQKRLPQQAFYIQVPKGEASTKKTNCKAIWLFFCYKSVAFKPLVKMIYEKIDDLTEQQRQLLMHLSSYAAPFYIAFVYKECCEPETDLVNFCRMFYRLAFLGYIEMQGFDEPPVGSKQTIFYTMTDKGKKTVAHIAQSADKDNFTLPF